MASYTVSTNAEQEEALDAALVKHNADLLLKDKEALQLTKEEFIQAEFDARCEDRCSQLKASKMNNVLTAYNNADAEKKAEFENLTK